MSRTPSSPPRKFQNVLDKWHYSKCSEIKIHFFVKNLYMGNQTEDQFLSFVKDRVQKAGPCEVIQITDKNQNERTIDIAIGMRYDNDAKLIYIGKKHINLISRNQSEKKIIPMISDIFLMMLREKGEVDKQALEEKLRQQRFGEKKRDRSSSQEPSRSESVNIKKNPNAIVLNLQVIQQQKTIPPPPPPIMDIQPVLLTIPKETLYIFGIPIEFTLQECLIDIKNRFNLQQLPEGTFKSEKQQDHIFEYLEVQLEMIQKNLQLKIKNVPCLICWKKKKTDSFSDILKQYQLFIKTQHPINTKKLLTIFQQYGDIIGLYELLENQEESSNSHCIVYTSDNFIKHLKPPGQIEIPEEKTIFEYRIPDQNFVSFQRIPYKSTLHAQITRDSSTSSSSSSSSSSSRSRSDSNPRKKKQYNKNHYNNRKRQNNYRRNNNYYDN